MSVGHLITSLTVGIVISLVATGEALSPLATLLLLYRGSTGNRMVPRRVLQGRAAPAPKPRGWADWGAWTPCSTDSVEGGVRARSRTCHEEQCDKLAGDNYEVQTCTHKAPEGQTRNEAMSDLCINDPTMRDSMSCKLYMENATMAYDIYFSTGCLLAILDDVNSENEAESDLVFGREPDPELGERGALFQGDLVTSDLSSGKFTGGAVSPNPVPPGQRDQNNRQANSGVSGLFNVLATNNVCTDVCQRIIVSATGISSFGSNAPNSVNGIVALLASNSLFRGNTAAIQNEYASCTLECRLFGPQYATARLGLASQGQDRAFSNGLRVTLNVGEGTGSGRRRRRRALPLLVNRMLELTPEQSEELQHALMNAENDDSAPPSVNAGLEEKPVGGDEFAPESQSDKEDGFPTFRRRVKAPQRLMDRVAAVGKKRKPVAPPRPEERIVEEQENVTAVLERAKRQAPPTSDPSSYTNPCFVREEFSRSPRVTNVDGTQGELFFFETKSQRFLRRRCQGPEIVRGSLYQPKETLTQERTKQQAVCKQGYLKRFGLMIFYDPEGEYAFSDGSRFSVKLRQFKLESHCEITVASP